MSLIAGRALRHRLALVSAAGWWRVVFGVAAAAILLALLLARKPWEISFEATNRMGRLRDFVNYWTWWAGAGNVLLFSALAAVAGWWSQPVEAERRLLPKHEKNLPLGVFLAAGLLMVLAIPRLGDSLWVDEDFSMRDAVWGTHRPGPDGEPVFRKRSWLETFYFYETPNNHVLYSVLGRLGLEAWLAVAKPSGLPFTEWPFRLPSLIAGVVGILAAGWLLSILGWRKAGVLAAWLLALNPWYVRYASEGRGFAMVMALAILLPAIMVMAVREGKWWWWTAYASAQFALFYTFPAAIYFLLVLNLGCLALLFFHGEAATPRAPQIGRWFLSCTLAGALAITLILPLQAQMLEYLQKDIARGEMGSFWILNVLSQKFAGVPWVLAPDDQYPSLPLLLSRQPLLVGGVAVGAMGAFVVGSLRCLRQGLGGGVVFATLILPGPMSFLVATHLGHYLFERYTMYMLPGLALLAALGLDLLRYCPVRGARYWPWIGVAAYAGCVSPVLLWQIERSTNPIRQSVLLTRPSLDPRDPRQSSIRTISFSFTPATYDARVRYVRTVPDFLAELRAADESGQELWVNIGNPWSAGTFEKELWQLMLNPQLFEPPIRLLGWNATMDRMVAKYRPGSVAKFLADSKLQEG